MHRTDYVRKERELLIIFEENFQLRQMSKIKKGMMELEETKRINKELFKIFQEQQYQTVNSS